MTSRMRGSRSGAPASRDKIRGLVVMPETTPQENISRISLGSNQSKKSTHGSYGQGLSALTGQVATRAKHNAFCGSCPEDCPNQQIEARRDELGSARWAGAQRTQLAAIRGKYQRRAQPSCVRGRDIRRRIADHPGALRVETGVSDGVQEQAGLGFAALTLTHPAG